MKGEHVNKIAFLADAVAKALTPPHPELLANARFYASFFFTCKNICFRNKKSIKKNFALKEKYLENLRYF